MGQKGQQVETEQKRREVLLTVTKVVLDMVVLGCAHVVVFVCDLPAPPTRLGDLGDTFLGQLMIGDKAVVIELLTSFAIDDRHLTPIYRQGTATAPQKDIVDIAQHRYCYKTAIPVAAFTCFDTVISLPKGQTLIERGMRGGLSDKEEIEAMWQDQLTPGLVAVEIIAKSGDAIGSQAPGVLDNPAFAGPPLAVLFVMAVLRHDVFWRQSDHF